LAVCLCPVNAVPTRLEWGEREHTPES
jgi:hypothetical protein